MASIDKDMKEKGTRLVGDVGEAIMQCRSSSRKKKIELYYDPVIPLLGIYPKVKKSIH